jgi:hypothetical protein
MWIGRADPSRSTRIPGAWVFSGCTNYVLRTCIQLSGLIQYTGTEYRCTTCLVRSFFSLHPSTFPPTSFPCTSIPPTHLPSGGSERGTGIVQYRYQIGWRGCRHRTPRLVRGFLWRVCLEDFPLARPQGERDGGGHWGSGHCRTGAAMGWSAIRIREFGNLMVTCSTNLPRSDITVGSVSFDVGFLVLLFPIFSPGLRGREVGLVGT